MLFKWPITSAILNTTSFAITIASLLVLCGALPKYVLLGTAWQVANIVMIIMSGNRRVLSYLIFSAQFLPVALISTLFIILGGFAFNWDLRVATSLASSTGYLLFYVMDALRPEIQAFRTFGAVVSSGFNVALLVLYYLNLVEDLGTTYIDMTNIAGTGITVHISLTQQYFSLIGTYILFVGNDIAHIFASNRRHAIHLQIPVVLVFHEQTEDGGESLKTLDNKPVVGWSRWRDRWRNSSRW